MANYYSQASFMFTLNPDQLVFAEKVLEAIDDGDIDLLAKHKTKKSLAYGCDVLKVAKKLVVVCDKDGYKNGFFNLDFQYEITDDEIWVYGEEHINEFNAANFCHLILKHFNSDEIVQIQVSYGCSKLRIDAFGGLGVFVTKKGIKYNSTGYWLQSQAEKYRKNLANAIS